MVIDTVFQTWSELKWISVIIAIVNGTRHFEQQNGSWRMLESNKSGKAATPQGLRHDVLGCCGPSSFCCGATDRFPVCGE